MMPDFKGLSIYIYLYNSFVTNPVNRIDIRLPRVLSYLTQIPDRKVEGWSSPCIFWWGYTIWDGIRTPFALRVSLRIPHSNSHEIQESGIQ